MGQVKPHFLLLALNVVVPNVWTPSQASGPVFPSFSEFELLLCQVHPNVPPSVQLWRSYSLPKNIPSPSL